MKNQGTIALIGILAGITSALLVLGARQNLDVSGFLLILTIMPVLIAGLAFGSTAVVLSLVSATVTLSLTVSPAFAAMIVALPLVPAAWIAYLANMARPASELGGPDNVMAWYPLSDMLLQLCCLVGLFNFIILAVTGYDRQTAADLVDMAAKMMAEQDPQLALTPEMIASMKTLYFYLLPMMQSVIWVLLIFAAYYFAALIVRMTTKTLRPREDMPSALRMSRFSIFFFLGGMVAMFIGGYFGLVGAVLCGSFGGGFLLAGLASFHFRTRGKSWRLPALILAYLTIFISAYFFVAAGLMDTRRAIALTPANRNKP